MIVRNHEVKDNYDITVVFQEADLSLTLTEISSMEPQ